MTRSKLIVNARSGPWDVRRELPVAVNHLESHGWRISLHETERAGEATQENLSARHL